MVALGLWSGMDGKLKIAGILFLGFLLLGAGWALWMGLKLFAWIAGIGLAIGIAAGVALGARKRLSGPPDRSRLS